ncbi:zinc binding alcohol dehydrogenase [Amycolatopsis methanolica 239]|uniref:Zinc binding alcohol dehydrogenase n=1 Tax=Amycolatopsis methanolica 239 TaxID=1068978 RepID=A0A076N3Y4_AMYME|nr:zinc binding alcohol dehydrogenase [Amycolatopsis methanolica 239]
MWIVVKALVVHGLDGPSAIRFDDVDEPPSDGKVLIEVRAAGVCYPDLLLTQGRYQARAQPPFVPGSEVAGLVVHAPDGSGFSAGDRVQAVVGLGAYAQRVAVDPGAVWRLPDELDFAEGAALLANHQTAHFALHRRAGLTAGETVLVLGSAGGVGSAAVQVATALGARVIAGVHRRGADEFVRGLGSDGIVPLHDGWLDRVREVTSGRGVDVVVDPVGGALFDDAVRALAPEGRLIVLGFAGGAIPQVKVNRLLLRNVSVVGAGWGEFLRTRPQALAETAQALQAFVARGLRPPVTRRFPLAEGAQALLDLEAGTVLGKAVLVTEG